MKIIAVYMCIEFIQQDVIMFDNKQALSSSTSPPSTLQHGKRYIYIYHQLLAVLLHNKVVKLHGIPMNKSS